MNSRERILAHLKGQPVDRLPLMPITMQFAADQIGVPYRQYATDYRTLVEAQLHTAGKFDFDFVSAISDPAREAADCGAEIAMFDNSPPALREDHALLAEPAALARLKIPDPHGGGRMTDRLRALELFKEKAGDKLIEGWVEGPMAEGADLRGINTIMLDFFDEPSFVRDLFEFVLEMELRFARAQLQSGADIIGVGDAAASLIGPAIYDEFVWPYQKKLVDGIHAAGGLVRLHICGNTSKIVEGMGRLGCDIVDLDYPVSMSAARSQMGPHQVLLGNLEPVGAIRNGAPEGIAALVADCHRAAGPRYIVGAGCEIPRDTPEANLRALCDYAIQHSPRSRV